MRSVLVLVLGAAACEAPRFEPECVEDGRVHSCSDVTITRRCTMMATRDVLSVDFDAPVEAAYEVELVADGEAYAFTCSAEDPADPVDNGWVASDPTIGCRPGGFELGLRANDLQVTVTVEGSAPVTSEVTPCWTVTEPNGRCCGFAYAASVTIPAR